jgi:hypothetical protein
MTLITNGFELRKATFEFFSQNDRMHINDCYQALFEELRARIEPVKSVPDTELTDATVYRCCHRIGLGGGGSIADLARTVLETYQKEFEVKPVTQPTQPIPAQDSGEALVGVECYLWNGEWYEGELISSVVYNYVGRKYVSLNDHAKARYWEHARPRPLGRLA